MFKAMSLKLNTLIQIGIYIRTDIVIHRNSYIVKNHKTIVIYIMVEYNNQRQLIGGTEATEDAQKDKYAHKSLEMFYKDHYFNPLKLYMKERTLQLTLDTDKTS